MHETGYFRHETCFDNLGFMLNLPWKIMMKIMEDEHATNSSM